MTCATFVALGLLLAPQDPPAPTPDELVLQGRFAEIQRPADERDVHALAAWAFARFHLACDPGVLAAARTAHEAGEVLGSYVLLLCLRNGDCVRRDPAREAALNHELRERLLAIGEPSAFELLALAATTPANEEGVVENATPNTPREIIAQRTRWLEAAAELGFAQAANLLGEEAQAGGDAAAAYPWFDRAARTGLPAAMKNKALLQLRGDGTERDVAAGMALAERAAEAGDCFAMINLAWIHDRGLGGKVDKEQARQWVDRAAGSGHWAGELEKAMALLTGNYGYPRDQGAAWEMLERAARSRRANVLMLIAGCYARGQGVAADADKARRIGEAAYVQGSSEAAGMLAWLHRVDRPGLPADPAAAAFWLRRSNGMADDPAQRESEEPLIERLRTLDPFALTIAPETPR